MSDLIQKLFPEGQRKLSMSLVTLAVGLILNHFHLLDENMRVSLLAILAIFTGGNVMEHLADALKVLKGTPVGKVIEDILPGDQGLAATAAKAPSVQAASGPSVAQVAAESASQAAQLASEAHDRIAEMEKKIAISNQNISQIVQILNQLRSANAPRAAAPTQPGS